MKPSFTPGKFIKQSEGYKAFTPELLPRAFQWQDPAINILLEEATRWLSELNAFSYLVPDVDFFIAMHVRKEALASSRIEGTKTEMDESLLPEEEISPEKIDDWNEVQNYIEAMNFSIKQLETLPVSMRLLKDSHKLLMKGVRGEKKSPGEIRRSQNWIGGSSISDAFFIPPHHSLVPELLGDLEKFLNDKQIQIPHLIKIAIGHYQFETIHPFLDGNGRIGRLLITLYLVSNNILANPTLYLSDYFEQHRSSYYDALTLVREKGDMEHWIKFFLVGIIQTARKGRRRFERIVDLRQKTEAGFHRLGKRARYAKQLVDYLYRYPITDVRTTEKILDITTPTANKLISELERIGVLVEITGQKRNRLFSFREYIQIFSDDKEPIAPAR